MLKTIKLGEVFATLALVFTIAFLFSQETDAITILQNKQILKLYPHAYDRKPAVLSPFTQQDGKEIVVACNNKGYFLVPVTVEKKEPFDSYYGKFIKGDQLKVDESDFPALAKTGLHSEAELTQTKTITGRSISEITEFGRPRRLSSAGFMNHDEDIISVLKGDNKLVEKMELIHPQLAKPLFHIWNLLLVDMEVNGISRYWRPFDYILYNGRKVFLKSMGTRGFQKSLFNDEIKGSFQIDIWVELNQEETEFLRERYSGLNAEQMTELINRISHIHTSEMEPYYIMRYGFYEGHTPYRTDPIAIAFIFGLRNLKDIQDSFPGKLYESLTQHFKEESK